MFVSLPQTAEQWRVLPKLPTGRSLQRYRKRVPCLLVPISSFDSVPPFARSATDVLFVPRWLRDLKAEDELRLDRRVDRDGNALAYRYHVDGVRRFRTGLAHVEAFVTEKE